MCTVLTKNCSPDTMSSHIKAETDENIPPPPRLERQDALSSTDVDMMVDTDEAMTTRYLQYDCRYRACKYPDVTWGALIEQDYDHFVELMSTEVPVDSNTFVALRSELKQEHVTDATSAVRTRDTVDGHAKIQKEFLDMKCTHRGRMGGKTWREIRLHDYSYFVWATGNSMGRETKTFRVLSSCLDKQGELIVNSQPKGQVQVRKNMVYVPNHAPKQRGPPR
jgi:hypothetical protein